MAAAWPLMGDMERAGRFEYALLPPTEGLAEFLLGGMFNKLFFFAS